jgi:hypothetical protein
MSCNPAMPALLNISRQAAPSRAVVFLWRKPLSLDVLAAGAGPAAGYGMSLIGIVIAEVLQSGADNGEWPNDLYLQDRKLSGILVELTGKPAMRHR